MLPFQFVIYCEEDRPGSAILFNLYAVKGSAYQIYLLALHIYNIERHFLSVYLYTILYCLHFWRQPVGSCQHNNARINFEEKLKVPVEQLTVNN